jgi:hypothetical protein
MVLHTCEIPFMSMHGLKIATRHLLLGNSSCVALISYIRVTVRCPGTVQPWTYCIFRIPHNHAGRISQGASMEGGVILP